MENITKNFTIQDCLTGIRINTATMQELEEQLEVSTHAVKLYNSCLVNLNKWVGHLNRLSK